MCKGLSFKWFEERLSQEFEVKFSVLLKNFTGFHLVSLLSSQGLLADFIIYRRWLLRARAVQKPWRAMAGCFSWLDHCPVHQKVADSMPGRGVCLPTGGN